YLESRNGRQLANPIRWSTASRRPRVGSANVGALQKSDELVAKLGRKCGLPQALRGIHCPTVGVQERHAGRAAFDVPFEQFGLLTRQCAFDVVSEQVHTLLTSDALRWVAH